MILKRLHTRCSDSIISSVADVVFMLIGFALGARLPVRISIALGVAFQIGVGLLIRDNMTLNVIMLLYPLEATKAWQLGG